MSSVRLTTNTVPGISFSHEGIHSNLISYDGYVIFFEQVGVRDKIWSLCGASVFKLRKQRPPMCYTSNVVRREERGGGFADLVQTQTWNLDPLPPNPCWQMELSTTQLRDQLLHLPHTLLAPTTFIILFYCWRPLVFFLLFFHYFPVWQAELSIIVLYLTDMECGLAPTQGRPRTAILWFLSTSLADVWWWHIWQKSIQDRGLGGCVHVCIERRSSNWTKTKLFTWTFSFPYSPLTIPSYLPYSNSFSYMDD